MRYTRWLVHSLALVALSAGGAIAGSFVPDADPPDTPIVDEPVSGADDDVMERLRSLEERFGDYRNEAFKQAALAAALKQAALYPSQLAGATPPKGVPKWRPLGPSSAKYQTNGVTLQISDSGRVRRVLQDAGDSDTVYVLTAGGGLWKTTTFGHTNPRWTPLTDALPSTSGGDMAFGRSSKTIYVGMGDPFDAVPTLTGGMVKTTDGGATWSSFVSLPGANTIQHVAVDTSGATDVVLVATDVALYRSTDAGATYAPVTGGFFWSLARTSAGWLASRSDGRILRSVNGGATWSLVAGALPAAGRTTLGVAVPGDAVVYAFAATPGDVMQKDLFRSSDGGVTWSALGITTKVPVNPNDFQPTMDLMGGQAFYNQMILVDAGDSSRNTVYLGGQLATAKTVDGGATWQLISDWLPGIYSSLPYVHADHHTASAIVVNGMNGVVFGTDGGIFVSTDGGASFGFDKNDGIDSMLAQTVMSSTKNPQSFALGMQDTGTRARLGASAVYNQVTGGDGEGIGWSQANNAATLTTAAGGTIFRSEGLLPNTIGNWTRVRPPLFTGDGRPFFTKIATPNAVADPSGLVFLTATNKRLWATVDGAAAPGSWFVLARAGGLLPSSFTVRENHHGIGLDVTADFSRPGPYGRIAVSGTGGQVAFTVDGGYTWKVKALIGLVPGYGGFNTATAWTRTGTLYVASENPNPGAVRMVKSADNGLTWQAADAGLPDVPVFHVVADPRDASGATLFAATSLGVYRTADGGASWRLFGAGLPNVRVMGLWMAGDGSVLRVATYGRGAWEIDP